MIYFGCYPTFAPFTNILDVIIPFTDLCIPEEFIELVCESAVTECDTGISIEIPEGYAVLASLDFRNWLFIA